MINESGRKYTDEDGRVNKGASDAGGRRANEVERGGEACRGSGWTAEEAEGERARIAGARVAPRRIPPLYNHMFLRVFGADGSKPATLALANAILRAAGAEPLERIDEISADRTEPGGAVLKSPRLDVVLRCDNRFVDIEAERRAVDVHDKSLYYASKLMVAHMSKGSDAQYRDAPQVAVITLLDGPVMFPGDEFLTVGTVHWEDAGGSCLRGKPNPLFVVVEMKKFRRWYNMLTEEILSDELLAWLYLLARGYENESEMSDMATTFEAMKDFAREYGYALDDPNLEHDFDRWFESQLEWNSTIDYAKRQAEAEGYAEGLKKGHAAGNAEGRAEGLAEGLAEGHAEGRKEVIDKLIALGVGEEIISQLS